MTFTIEIKPSGHKFVAGVDETVLDAALRNGIAFPYSCRGGTCGSCKGKILQGEVGYIEQPIALSSREKENGYALFCRARARSDMVIELKQVSAAKQFAIKTMPCRVATMERLASDVMRLSLKLPQTEGFNYLPGQYLDILLRDGRRRSFSLANAPEPGQMLELHIRYVEGGFFTSQVFTTMQEKALLRIEGPFGTFYLREESDRPIIFLAGGTGFAPIKSIMESILKKDFRREIVLYWGARNRESLYMHDLPQRWARENARFRYVPVLSEPNEDDHWTGRTGYVHQAVIDDIANLSNYEIYACGSPLMVEAARESFFERGATDDRFFTDAFTFSNDADVLAP